MRLPIRLSPELQRSAERYAYRIPGRAARQGHRDYATRPLSAAVTAAIALEEPFREPRLADLPEFLEHRAGDGLWRLVIAASLTGEERRALSGAERPLHDMIMDGEVMWHSPERSALALHIAKRLLIDSDSSATLKAVAEQQEQFIDWQEELVDPRVIYGGHEVSDGAPPLGGSKEGRAATAVWRARHTLERERIAAWATSGHSTPEIELNAPAWTLTMPQAWHSRRFPRTAAPPARLHEEWERGKVLRIDSGRQSAFWPVTRSGGPVPLIEHVLKGMGLTDPVRLAEALLVSKDSRGDDSVVHLLPLRINSASAFAAGLISQGQRDDLVSWARAATETDVKSCLMRLERSHGWSSDTLTSFRDAVQSPQKFSALCQQYGVTFAITYPNWHWEIESIEAALNSSPPLTPTQLTLLGREWRRLVDRAIGHVQHTVWTGAMWDYNAQEVDQTVPDANAL